MKNFIQSVLILIAVLLSTTGAEEVIYAQVGEKVTLIPPDGHSNKYVYWHFGDKNGLQLAWCNPLGGKGFIDTSKEQDQIWKSLSLIDNKLIIDKFQQENFGTFICKTSDPSVTITYKILKLNVTAKTPSLLLPGESLSLVCDAETPQSHKKPAIHWLNPQGEKIYNNQREFTVKATGQHNGQWTCVVTNNNKEKKAALFVTIVDLSPAPQNTYTSLSSPLTVPCSLPAHISWEQIKDKDIRGVHWDFIPKPGSSLISNDPQSLFSLSLEDPLTWKANNNLRLTATELKKGLSLDLSLTGKQGQLEDRGDYVCSLEFPNNRILNRTIHVNVLEIISSQGTDFISGQQVNLTCSLGYPLPSDLRLKWFPPEQSSLPSLRSDHHPAHLTIPEVGTGDGGKWRCELWQNGTRLTSAAITLKIEHKLSVWMLVIICSVAVIVILLILVFILYRHRQWKIRHLRHRLCQCKNPKPKGFYRT